MPRMERHAFLLRVIKEYKNNYSNDFDYFVNDNLIEGNWKIKLFT